MSHITSLLAQSDADALKKLAGSSETIFGKVAGAMAAESLEKVARFGRIRAGLLNEHAPSDEVAFLLGDNPLVFALQDYVRDHPPANMEALRDLYSQAVERSLQTFLSKTETGDDADPMALALKNLNRMAQMLETRLDMARAQKELETFQQEAAIQQGLSPENPALAATAQLPPAPGGPEGPPAPGPESAPEATTPPPAPAPPMM